jgi:hypothetical protein
MSDNLSNKDAKTLDCQRGLQEKSTYANHGINPEPASNSQKDGFAVSSQVVVGPIKKVDRGQSDQVGDLAKSSLFQSVDNGGPRRSVNQFPLGRNTRSDFPARNWVGNLDDSDAGN